MGPAGAEIEHAPVGFGSHHWQVRRGEERWFATVDDLHGRRQDDAEPIQEPLNRLAAALTGARQLHEIGLGFVVAPLPDTSGLVLHALDRRYVLALYPFVSGRTHTGAPS